MCKFLNLKKKFVLYTLRYSRPHSSTNFPQQQKMTNSTALLKEMVKNFLPKGHKYLTFNKYMNLNTFRVFLPIGPL